MPARHEMVRTAAGSDTEEWCCATCGRRIVLRRPPRYQRLVLDPGDDTALHAGGTGGVAISGAEVAGFDDEGWLADNGIAWPPRRP